MLVWLFISKIKCSYDILNHWKWRKIEKDLGACTNGWTNLGVTQNNYTFMVAIAMPMLLYKFINLLQWTCFKNINLNIYMMHKIILQNLKDCKHHRLLNSKLVDCTCDCHFFVDYDIVHCLMGVLKDLKLVRYHNNEAKCKKNINWNFSRWCLVLSLVRTEILSFQSLCEKKW
jgi:hypothetical protein